jgi:hypothetical protein
MHHQITCFEKIDGFIISKNIKKKRIWLISIVN